MDVNILHKLTFTVTLWLVFIRCEKYKRILECVCCIVCYAFEQIVYDYYVPESSEGILVIHCAQLCMYVYINTHVSSLEVCMCRSIQTSRKTTLKFLALVVEIEI